MLLPNDHLRMLIELLRPDNIELTRRWVAALMLAPESERSQIVSAVEKQLVEEFRSEAARSSMHGFDLAQTGLKRTPAEPYAESGSLGAAAERTTRPRRSTASAESRKTASGKAASDRTTAAQRPKSPKSSRSRTAPPATARTKPAQKERGG